MIVQDKRSYDGPGQTLIWWNRTHINRVEQDKPVLLGLVAGLRFCYAEFCSSACNVSMCVQFDLHSKVHLRSNKEWGLFGHCQKCPIESLFEHNIQTEIERSSAMSRDISETSRCVPGLLQVRPKAWHAMGGGWLRVVYCWYLKPENSVVPWILIQLLLDTGPWCQHHISSA